MSLCQNTENCLIFLYQIFVWNREVRNFTNCQTMDISFFLKLINIYIFCLKTFSSRHWDFHHIRLATVVYFLAVIFMQSKVTVFSISVPCCSKCKSFNIWIKGIRDINVLNFIQTAVNCYIPCSEVLKPFSHLYHMMKKVPVKWQWP